MRVRITYIDSNNKTRTRAINADNLHYASIDAQENARVDENGVTETFTIISWLATDEEKQKFWSNL